MKNFEEINEQNRKDKMNELATKWEFCLEQLNQREEELLTSNVVNNKVKSVACGIAADQLKSCVEDLRELIQYLNTMENYHRNCVNLINNTLKN
tara:strand:+ start:833 stop:1114 length:282 start_codon:yes stop_codon:yes gene_type:complete